jgi:hypothetical protein
LCEDHPDDLDDSYDFRSLIYFLDPNINFVDFPRFLAILIEPENVSIPIEIVNRLIELIPTLQEHSTAVDLSPFEIQNGALGNAIERI